MNFPLFLPGINRLWLLRNPVPLDRPVEAADFVLAEHALPTPDAGEVLLRTIYLSLDPSVRGRISPAKNYKQGISPGQVVTGRVVGEVICSKHEDYTPGDFVMGETGWQEYALAEGRMLRRVDPALAPVSTALGLLGIPGLTAYFALLERGMPRPGDTVLVTAAAGGVGSIVGQIAKIAGCKTIALAGSNAKIDYCRQELGYDAAINYRQTPDLSDAIARYAPEGINVFFDSAGGAVHQAVLPHLAVHARVVICGVMSQYNPTAESQASSYNLRHLLISRARVEGFLIYDFMHRSDEGLQRLAAWHTEGRIKYRENICYGIESAPTAFIGMLRGDNLGKQLVQVGLNPEG